MPIRMETTIRKIDLIPNTGSGQLITEFHAYLKDHGNSERDQHNYLKVLIPFALYLGPNTSLSAVYDQAQVTAFLDTKKKDLAVDRDQKWIVIWNSYLARIRHFYRWLYSQRHREPIPQEEWETPHLVKIRDKKTKTQSPYDVAQTWDLHEMPRILPYATHIETRQPSLFSGTSMLETTKLRSWPFTMSGCGRTMGRAKFLWKDTNSSLCKVGLFF